MDTNERAFFDDLLIASGQTSRNFPLVNHEDAQAESDDRNHGIPLVTGVPFQSRLMSQRVQSFTKIRPKRRRPTIKLSATRTPFNPTPKNSTHCDVHQGKSLDFQSVRDSKYCIQPKLLKTGENRVNSQRRDIASARNWTAGEPLECNYEGVWYHAVVSAVVDTGLRIRFRDDGSSLFVESEEIPKLVRCIEGANDFHGGEDERSHGEEKFAPGGGKCMHDRSVTMRGKKGLFGSRVTKDPCGPFSPSIVEDQGGDEANPLSSASSDSDAETSVDSPTVFESTGSGESDSELNDRSDDKPFLKSIKSHVSMKPAKFRNQKSQILLSSQPRKAAPCDRFVSSSPSTGTSSRCRLNWTAGEPLECKYDGVWYHAVVTAVVDTGLRVRFRDDGSSLLVESDNMTKLLRPIESANKINNDENNEIHGGERSTPGDGECTQHRAAGRPVRVRNTKALVGSQVSQDLCGPYSRSTEEDRANRSGYGVGDEANSWDFDDPDCLDETSADSPSVSESSESDEDGEESDQSDDEPFFESLKSHASAKLAKFRNQRRRIPPSSQPRKKVASDRFVSSSPSTEPPSRCRHWTAGEPLECKYDGVWYPAIVEAVVDTGIRIRFQDDGARTLIERSHVRCLLRPVGEDGKDWRRKDAKTNAKPNLRSSPKHQPFKQTKGRTGVPDIEPRPDDALTPTQAEVLEALNAVRMRPIERSVVDGGGGLTLGLLRRSSRDPYVSLDTWSRPNLTALVTKWACATLPPEARFTTLQINFNASYSTHVDDNSTGDSYITCLGDFEGGELWLGNGLGPHNARGSWVRFAGGIPHATMPFTGNRISVIAFTLTCFVRHEKSWLSSLEVAPLGFRRLPQTFKQAAAAFSNVLTAGGSAGESSSSESEIELDEGDTDFEVFQAIKYVGRKVQKSFDEGCFNGVVTRFNRLTNWYTIFYSDGDREELTLSELKKTLF